MKQKSARLDARARCRLSKLLVNTTALAAIAFPIGSAWATDAPETSDRSDIIVTGKYVSQQVLRWADDRLVKVRG
ncbi:hypothetical protein ACFOKF_22575 [Sphingobium rhizovicinum]|uniref:Uncharacterized protein n=1 Tax=Sphingobium rhizovicinum TaxID=432308 RepID=A0ABV7NMH4_9SPHN